MELDNKPSAVISTTNIGMMIEDDCTFLHMSNTTVVFYDNSHKLLIKAFNNRTRERNYFKLCCEMLDGDITEDDFDKEIEQNPDDYVVPAGDDDSVVNIQAAISLTNKLKGIKTTDDFASLFQFSENKINKCLEAK